jgi:hypothetical protein
MRPYLENTQHKKRAGEAAKVVEHLPNKYEALSSNPHTAKKKKKKKRNNLSFDSLPSS